MSSSIDFKPQCAPYSATKKYLDVKDSEGNRIYTEFFKSEKKLQKRFEELSHSAEPPSLLKTVFVPAICNSPSEFISSLFLPNTSFQMHQETSFLISTIVCIATYILDLATLPIRLLTMVPYVVYSKFLCPAAPHPIVKLLGFAPSHPEIKLEAVTERFSKIEPGKLRNERMVRLDGSVTTTFANVHLRESFDMGTTKTYQSKRNVNGILSSKIAENYEVNFFSPPAKTGRFFRLFRN